MIILLNEDASTRRAEFKWFKLFILVRVYFKHGCFLRDGIADLTPNPLRLCGFGTGNSSRRGTS